MTQAEKLLYTARTRRTTGRISRNSDGRLDVKLSPRGGAGIHDRADLAAPPPTINKVATP